MVFSCLRDKEPALMIKSIENYLNKNKLDIPILITEIQNNERAMPKEELKALFTLPVRVYDSLGDILKALPETVKEEDRENPCVICGSLYFLSEYYRLYPEKLQLSY